MQRKGFTLIELLAVIVIIGILLAIAIPSITKVYNNGVQNSFEVDAKNVAGAIYNYLLQHPNYNVNNINETNLKSFVGISVDNYKTVSVTKTDDFINVVIVGQNKWEGYTAYGTKEAMTVVNSKDYVAPTLADNSGASAPELASNMIPIIYDGTNWVKADANNLVGTYSWYNYANKQWANAVTVTSATLYTYQSAPVGTVIPEANILTYLVWIPRYKYAIPAGTGARTINIVFENKTATKSTGDATGTNYRTHPAFTFGTVELNGFWVGKFETTGTISNITVKPNVASLRSQKVALFFIAMRNMESSDNAYGFASDEVDTHMMLNSEWGAVAYLSMSTYGFNNEVWINPNSNYLTGQAGTSVSAGQIITTYVYNDTTYGVKASTTGTIYGVYDMSGGAWEYVMGNYNNYSGYNATYNSGFNGSYGGGGSLTTGISFPDSKYYNLYTTDVASTACNGGICYGQALSETDNWYGDYDGMIGTTNMWFVRGGNYSSTTQAGVFNSSYANGYSGSNTSTRLVVAMTSQ